MSLAVSCMRFQALGTCLLPPRTEMFNDHWPLSPFLSLLTGSVLVVKRIYFIFVG